jgi:CRISPR/Cas system-associated exonuclease Cas4 (RecB family)
VIDIIGIYNEYIASTNKLHQKKRYDGHEKWFHASASGMCMRKHYFQHVAKVKPKPIDKNTLRLFRLGDLVHGDIQDALGEYAQNNGTQIFIEKEIQLPEVSVRGFLDIIVADDNALYDIKTCNSFKWKKLFGRYPDPAPSINYHLQLGTYAWWYEQAYNKRIKKLALIYYQKDTSAMREYPVDVQYIEEAKNYWADLNERFKKGNPAIELGVAPAYAWECNPKYCGFFGVCGGGLKSEGDTKL